MSGATSEHGLSPSGTTDRLASGSANNGSTTPRHNVTSQRGRRLPDQRSAQEPAARAESPPSPTSTPHNAHSTDPAREESLVQLLGGRRGALDATAPAVAFVAGWLLADESVEWGVAAALTVGGLVTLIRLARGIRPRAALLGLLGVCVAALVALRTGRAADFFLLQVVSNLASALAWSVSILLRWPLLGVVVCTVLGQRTRWRRDPDLLRAYSRASWVWVGQYAVRLAVFLPLWATDQVVALGAARVALSWPLVAACLVVSWWVMRTALPPGHPGPRHPVTS